LPEKQRACGGLLPPSNRSWDYGENFEDLEMLAEKRALEIACFVFGRNETPASGTKPPLLLRGKQAVKKWARMEDVP